MLSIARDLTESRLREQRLTDAAYEDYLTGLPNRRALLLIVGQRKRTAGTGDDCIVLLDIDHFKKINDSFGHDAGDEVPRVRPLGSRRAEVRGPDGPAGWREFVIFFPGTSKDEALAVCNRIRALVSSAPILVGPHAIRFTVSGGVAALGEGGIEQALTAADAALYEAKNGGRNRLALAA